MEWILILVFLTTPVKHKNGLTGQADFSPSYTELSNRLRRETKNIFYYISFPCASVVNFSAVP